MEKDASISLIRLISLLLIIGCHILQGLDIALAFYLNVGVEIFFFISGFLYGKKNITSNKAFYVSRILKIYVPYIFFVFIILLIDRTILNSSYSFIKMLNAILATSGLSGNCIPIISHTWFVSYILLCYMLVPFLQSIFESKNANNNKKLILVCALAFLFQCLRITSISSAFINNFILGYYYNKCCTTKSQRRRFEVCMIVFFFLLFPVSVIFQENIYILGTSFFLRTIIIEYGHVFLGVVIFIYFYKLFARAHFRNNIILNTSDKYSYFIYLVHQVFILNSFSLLRISRYLFVDIILIIVFSCSSAYILRFISCSMIDAVSCIYKKRNGISFGAF